MKRKVLVSMLLSMVLAFGLSACGGQEDVKADAEVQKEEQDKEFSEKESAQENVAEESKNDEGSQSSKVEEKEVEEEDFWKSKDNLTIPSFEAVEVEEKTALDGMLSYKISATPFHYDMDNMEEVLGNNEYVKGIYNIDREKAEKLDDFETFEEGDFHTYSIEEAIIGRVKGEENQSYFTFRIHTDHKLFKDPNKVSLWINNVSQTNLGQDKVYSMAEDVFGKEIAEYLVYSPSNSESPGKDDMFDFYGEVAGSDGARYSLKRDIGFDKKNKTWKVALYIELYSPAFSTTDNYAYDDGGNELMYNSAKYTVSDITKNGLSNADFNKFSTIFPEYTDVDAGGEIIRNGLGYFTYTEENQHNGDKIYSFDMDNLSTLLKDVPEYQQPEMDVKYTVKENNEGIYYLSANFSGDYVYRHVENRNDEKVLACMVEQASVLMPYADFSEVIYSAEQETYKVTGTHSLMGVECEYSVNFKLYADCSWDAKVSGKK